MECKRCGECCRGGGPALHHDDKAVIEKGVITRKHMVTLRRGEMAIDKATGVLEPIREEIIKLKGIGKQWVCCFWNHENCDCTIYADRPAECRALECWDTSALEDMYRIDRLTRQDLVNTDSGLWEIITEHESRCSLNALNDLAQAWLDGDEKAGADIITALNYDEAIRDLMVERTGAAEEELDFYFGRPLVMSLTGFGVKARKWGEDYQFSRVETGADASAENQDS
ncbi:MAG: YkgJ family cysteine cluster protein [Desulfovibrio sp.]|nr:MAG: YkgJ family cysteine cluster protein [Desulfovibrio sp.]